MIARMYDEQHEKLLAACDKELLGKTLQSNNLYLEISEEFYGNKTVTHEELNTLMDSCTIANLVGEKVISLAIEKKFVKKENTIDIQGIPHAQFARMPKKVI
ncbi:DUF424 family protein [archaeon]|nr:DUF424 family protein [archaeon]